MRVIVFGGILLLMCIWSRVRGVQDMTNIVTCDSNISVQCTENNTVVLIEAINTTSSVASDFLTQCNAHKECQVLNKDNECVEVQDNCVKFSPVLELKESSTVELTTSSSLFYLISEGYLQGKQTLAQNVQCDLFGKSGSSKRMYFIIHEFSPLLNSSDFCLKVQGAKKVSFCSGSQKFNDYYGPFNSDKGWTFNLQLKENVTSVPHVRFWIAIAGHKDESKYHLKCTSDAVSVMSFGIFAKLFISCVIFLHLTIQHRWR